MSDDDIYLTLTYPDGKIVILTELAGKVYANIESASGNEVDSKGFDRNFTIREFVEWLDFRKDW